MIKGQNNLNLPTVAVIGCGYWGVNYVRNCYDSKKVFLSAVSDLNESRLKELEEKYPGLVGHSDVSKIMNDKSIDSVIIATQATTHYGVVKAALESGKHVLVEKPMTTTTSEAVELKELAKKVGKTLMVGHTFLFNKGVQKVSELMKKEEFGTPYYMHFTRTNMGPVREDVNCTWDLAAHDISIANHFAGGRPEWVSCVGGKYLGSNQSDVSFANLVYSNGMIANIHLSWLTPNKVREVVVVGGNQSISFNDMNPMEPVRVFYKGVKQQSVDSFGEFKLLMTDGDILSPKVAPAEPLRTQIEHFFEVQKGAVQLISDAQIGEDVVRVLCALDESMEQNGQPVYLEGEASSKKAA